MFAADVKKSDFELLCRDGSRKSIDEFDACHWGKIPSNAIVVSSATGPSKRKLYQKFLEDAAKIFGKQENRTDTSRNDYYSDRFDNRQGKSLENDRESEYNRDYENRNNNFDGRNNYDNYYSSTPTYNDQDRGNFPSLSDPTIQTLDKFRIFESGARYENSHNLLFSVSFTLCFFLFF